MPTSFFPSLSAKQTKFELHIRGILIQLKQSFLFFLSVNNLQPLHHPPLCYNFSRKVKKDGKWTEALCNVAGRVVGRWRMTTTTTT